MKKWKSRHSNCKSEKDGKSMLKARKEGYPQPATTQYKMVSKSNIPSVCPCFSATVLRLFGSLELHTISVWTQNVGTSARPCNEFARGAQVRQVREFRAMTDNVVHGKSENGTKANEE